MYFYIDFLGIIWYNKYNDDIKKVVLKRNVKAGNYMPFELFLIIGYILLISLNVVLYRIRHYKLWTVLGMEKDKQKKEEKLSKYNKARREMIK